MIRVRNVVGSSIPNPTHNPNPNPQTQQHDYYQEFEGGLYFCNCESVANKLQFAH
jgi:hypothetical protein